ncbi:hypothetical protein SSS_10637 [Sarcoptes scabiei]|uniref:Uncharacterized protein n=1 Tax=Sarcoptes scabiei TaxID=52283 RepID=A0A834R3Z7_SARSC|nr:hypothetical protein SSS_10637 [Sarcoptes scabiei]
MSFTKSNSSNSKNAGGFASLADILSTSKNKKTSTSSGNFLPSLEDLQKKLGQNDASNFKLNTSQFLQNSSNTVKTNSINERNQEPQFGKLNAKLSINDHSRSRIKREDKFSNIKFSLDSQNEILHIVNQIEKSKNLTDFDDKDRDQCVQFDSKRKQILRQPNFFMINLPDDFNLENSQMNVYQSGMIEILSGDKPSKIIRLKRNSKMITDLVLANDSQVFHDQMNILTDDSINF